MYLDNLNPELTTHVWKKKYTKDNHNKTEVYGCTNCGLIAERKSNGKTLFVNGETGVYKMEKQILCASYQLNTPVVVYVSSEQPISKKLNGKYHTVIKSPEEVIVSRKYVWILDKNNIPIRLKYNQFKIYL